MSRDIVLFVSDSRDAVGSAFAEHCRARDIEVVLATRQAETRLYVEISDTTSTLLRVGRPDGRALPVEGREVRGVWFRGLPDPPDGFDEDDTDYAQMEFTASLAAYMRALDVACFGHGPLNAACQDSVSIHEVREWCRRESIPLLPFADTDYWSPIPIHDHLAGEEIVTPLERRPRPDGIYYVRFGTRRRLLAMDGIHSPAAIERAGHYGDRIVAFMRLDTAVIEFAPGGDGPDDVALGEIAWSVPEAIILRDRQWYFDAALETLGV